MDFDQIHTRRRHTLFCQTEMEQQKIAEASVCMSCSKLDSSQVVLSPPPTPAAPPPAFTPYSLSCLDTEPVGSPLSIQRRFFRCSSGETIRSCTEILRSVNEGEHQPVLSSTACWPFTDT